MKNKRILIADDHPSIRRGVKNILSASFSHIVFGEAADTADVLQKLQDNIWDVIILDIDFPGRSGLDVLKYIKEEGIKTPVLVFSFHHEEQIALRALKMGASGYLSKDVADVELITAIRQLLSGRKYISQFISERLITQLQNPMETPAHEFLADREFQTLLLIARGKTVTEIARELNLSISTINTYRSRILIKMGMKNNAELTNYAFKNRLINQL